jgi:hypothetical protein
MEDFVGYRGFYQSVSINEHLFIQATTSAFTQILLTFLRIPEKRLRIYRRLLVLLTSHSFTPVARGSAIDPMKDLAKICKFLNVSKIKPKHSARLPIAVFVCFVFLAL